MPFKNDYLEDVARSCDVWNFTGEKEVQIDLIVAFLQQAYADGYAVAVMDALRATGEIPGALKALGDIAWEAKKHQPGGIAWENKKYQQR